MTCNRFCHILSVLAILPFTICFTASAAEKEPNDSVHVAKDSIGNSSISLSEVVVTAQESRKPTSASIIDTAAMRHLQPSSFSDLMSLLPGGITKDPDMASVNIIALRQASNITPTDDYLTSALGTSFVIDGVPVNNSSQLQTTSDTNQSGRIPVGKGVDMRTISTDDIEKIEVVRGIPSVEYGELTSGLVNITRKRGISRLEARFKADTQSQLIYIGKGIGMPGENWVLNTGFDYLNSKIDPRNSRENFQRISVSARSNKRWANESIATEWNSALTYRGTFEHDDNDPDLTINNTVDYFSTQNHSISWNNTVAITAMTGSAFRSLNITAGINYSDERLRQKKHVSPSRILPLPVSMTPGSNYVGYLPMLYLAELDVIGKPFTSFAKISSAFRFMNHTLVDNIKAGIEWNMNKNYGAGQVYDIERPISAGNNSRPRAYSDVPAMHQLSAYVENDARIFAGDNTFLIVAGVRGTSLLNLDSRFALHGKVYLDPRFNATWRFPKVYLKDYPVSWEISGGCGWHTKMPVAAFLYPDKLYSDFEQLNYYHNNPDYRTMNVMTFVDDMTNYNLKAARNFKWEIRGDISYRGNRISVTYFRENMNDGFRYSGIVKRYTYNRYDASGFNPEVADRAPVIEELPYTETTSQNVRTMITNGSSTKKEGIEYTFQSRRFPRTHTRITVSGAYFKTTNNNSQPLWYKPSIIVDNKEMQYIGLYDDTDGSIYRSFNTNIMFDTDIPSLNLNFSLTVENMWFTSRQTLWRDGIPTHYMAPDGNIHPYTAESQKDPYLLQLIRNFSSGAFDRLTVPAESNFNLKATKQFWNNRIGIALYVNRIFSIHPDYKRYGVTIRRYSSPYFGMELNFKI